MVWSEKHTDIVNFPDFSLVGRLDTKKRMERFYNVRKKRAGNYPVEKIVDIKTKHGKRKMAVSHDEEGTKLTKFVSSS